MEIDLSKTIKKRTFYPIYDESLMTYTIAGGILMIGFPMAVWNEDEDGKTFLDDLIIKSEILKKIPSDLQSNLYVEAYIDISKEEDARLRFSVYTGTEEWQKELLCEEIHLTESEKASFYSRMETFLGREVLEDVFENSTQIYNLLNLLTEGISDGTES